MHREVAAEQSVSVPTPGTTRKSATVPSPALRSHPESAPPSHASAHGLRDEFGQQTLLVSAATGHPTDDPAVFANDDAGR